MTLTPAQLERLNANLAAGDIIVHPPTHPTQALYRIERGAGYAGYDRLVEIRSHRKLPPEVRRLWTVHCSTKELRRPASQSRPPLREVKQ